MVRSIHRLVPAVALVLAAMAAADDAAAQARSMLVGTVRDLSGAVVAGAAVTVSPVSLLGDPVTRTTDARGYYRLADLVPGVYDLSATFGIETVQRFTLRLPVGTALTVDLTFGAASRSERTAADANPVVDVTSPTSSLIFDREALERLPIENVNNLAGLSPGVVRGVFGGPPNTNMLTIEGSPTTFTHRGGPASVPIHPYWMDQAQVIGLGATANVGEFTGVVTNVALRSGSNRLAGLVEHRSSPSRGVADNTGSLPDALRATFRPQRILSKWAGEIQAGGPVAPDRLFFFTGLSWTREKLFQAGTIGDVPFNRRQADLLVRLTAARWRNMSLEGFTHVEPSRATGMLTPNRLPETAGENSGMVWDWNGSFRWAGTRTLVEVRNNGLDFTVDTLPESRRTGPYPRTDRITQIQSGNQGTFSDTFARRILTTGRVRHVLDDVYGGHELQAGVEYDRTVGLAVFGYPGGRFHVDAAGVPEEVMLWDGDTIESLGVRTSLYVQDVWRIGSRLTVHPGLRIGFDRGSVPDKGRVFNTNPVSPRVGLAWDVTADHKTVVRAAYGRLHEGLYPTLFDFLDTAGRNPVIRARVLEGGSFQVISRSPIATQAVDDRVRHAYADNYLAALEREVWPRLSVQAQYIRRNFGDIWGFIDTLAQYTPAQRRDPGPDGRLLTADDGALLSVFDRVNPSESFPVLTNPAGAFRRYDAVQVIAQKHLSGNWQVLAAYTWSRTRGTINNGNGDNRAAGGDTNSTTGVYFNPNRTINAEGRANGDCPHQLNVQGTYLLSAWGGVGVSGAYRYVSGLPWGRSAILTGLAQGNQPVRIEPRGTRRLPAVSQLDLRVEKSFPIGSRSVGVYADLFNATNQGAQLTVQEGSGAAFGQPSGANGWSSPRTIQVAVRAGF